MEGDWEEEEGTPADSTKPPRPVRKAFTDFESSPAASQLESCERPRLRLTEEPPSQPMEE